ncbi:sulfite exporter TauE/SafE family protein [Paenisporosarcina quisquiliarum]|uniref:urease accessory protein UreH domain-containing protein n=1 Tax=Paenisporosarcina quisquiliarum TaxID=365346 RepID=UPI003735DDBE
MYSLLSKISTTLSEPFSIFAHSFSEYPFLVAIFLGLVGALAPCQLTGNISAITYYGNRTIQNRTDWLDVLSFILGKIVVFSSLGLLVWLFGHTFEQSMVTYFPFLRNLVGPLIIFVGLVLLGVFKLNLINRITSRIPLKLRKGKLGSFLMGVSFSIAFCPTMFVLFFVSLMPLTLTSTYGLVLPALFGIATSLPLLLVLVMMWFLELDNRTFKNSKRFGFVVQKTAGVLLVIIGVVDTITYWAI